MVIGFSSGICLCVQSRCVLLQFCLVIIICYKNKHVKPLRQNHSTMFKSVLMFPLNSAIVLVLFLKCKVYLCVNAFAHSAESTRAPEKKMTHQPSAEGKGADKISTHRGDLNPLAEPSFAPNDFVFEAPSSVTSFVFKPLSPASAASFLFPSASGNSTTMSIFTKRVGR